MKAENTTKIRFDSLSVNEAQHAPDQLRRVLQLAQIPCNDVQQKEE